MTSRPENWEQLATIADVLEQHMPSTDSVKCLIHCGCGWVAHFIDARAWHRHAAAMAVLALALAAPLPQADGDTR